MYYITVRQPPKYHQMTLEEFLFGTEVDRSYVSWNYTNTKTYRRDRISEKIRGTVNVNALIEKLKAFNEATAHLHDVDRHKLYYEFYIPKKSGGLRKIDAPEMELMTALRNLKTLFEVDFGALYHTSAFAYIKGRSTIKCVQRHQRNESRWFEKLDLSNFFGSTTPEYVERMFSMVFPFSEVLKDEVGKQQFRRAIDLAFLDGGLPQGTPISPLITNIIMIPIDYTLSNKLRDFNNQSFVYTRYADDFIISSKYNFNFRDVENELINTLAEFGAPFTINKKKTRYGSSAGKNYNLGVMLNAENKITVGHKRKRQFHAMLNSFVLDSINGKKWPLNDIQVLDGYRNYYKMVEGDTIDNIVNKIGNKYGVDIVELIKKQLKTN